MAEPKQPNKEIGHGNALFPISADSSIAPGDSLDGSYRASRSRNATYAPRSMGDTEDMQESSRGNALTQIREPESANT